MVVVLYPQTDPLACRLETVKLRSHQELFPDRLPEPFDLAERHGMMRQALDVMDPILAQLRFKARGSPPTGILAPLIGEQFFGHAVFGHRRAVHLQDMLGRLAAKDVRSHQVAGEIIPEPDQVGVLACEAEGEDVGLPHLVGRRALKKAWLLGVAARFRLPLLQQLLLVQGTANRLPAHRQKQRPPQEMTNFLDAQAGVPTLKLDDFGLDRRRHLGPVAGDTSGMRFEAGLALLAIHPDPLAQGTEAHTQFAGYLLGRKTFFQTELNRFAPDFIGM